MTTTSELTPLDRTAIEEVPGRIVAAWAGHDAGAFARVFTPDGTMILPGALRSGREEIEEYMGQAFAGPYRGTRVTGSPVGLRVLADGLALLFTYGGVLLPGESEVAPERAVRASWLVARRNGAWQLAAYQNSPA
jgi:uncharacterized protein (TIGR02246 family)